MCIDGSPALEIPSALLLVKAVVGNLSASYIGTHALPGPLHRQTATIKLALFVRCPLGHFRE